MSDTPRERDDEDVAVEQAEAESRAGSKRSADSRPASAGEHAATASAGEQNATASGGEHAATASGGEHAATASGGEHAATASGGEHAATPSGREQAGTAGDAEVEHLRARTERAEAKANEAEERAVRLQAEMDNLRKRTQREVENAHKYGVEKLLGELLPVIDSMELGLDAASDGKGDVKSMRDGMELTLRMLRTATEKFGIEPVDPAGQPFDPDAHQAISMQQAEGTKANTVLTVVQKGYKLNGRLVRPAMVIVAR